MLKRIFLMLIIGLIGLKAVEARDLAEILQQGELRHLSIPYANFNLGDGRGFSVELVKAFSQELKVKYVYVASTWQDILGDLLGRQVYWQRGSIFFKKEVPIKGDIIATGFTKLVWRERVVSFSEPTFPTQVWLVAKASSYIKPIVPSGDEVVDINNTLHLTKGKVILGKKGTCLDPDLYNLKQKGAYCYNFEGKVNDIAGALLEDKAELALLDVPDVLVAMLKWPGKLKVIGPVSKRQYMACAFRKNSPKLLNRFNSFLNKIKANGFYLKLVKKYFPESLYYFPDFFNN